MCLAWGVQTTYRKHITHHMKLNHFFFWSCCGPYLKEKKQCDLSCSFQCHPNEVSCAKWGVLKTKRTDETKWTKEGATLYLSSKHRSLYPAYLSFYDISHTPHHHHHPLGAPVEITGELSVCGKACLSYGRSEEGMGVLGGRKTEKMRKNRDSCFAAVLCCLWHSFLCVSGDNLFSTGPFIQGLSAGVRQDGK